MNHRIQPNLSDIKDQMLGFVGFVLFVVFLFWRPHKHMTFRSFVTYTRTLYPLTPCARLRIKPASWCCRDTASPTVSQLELQVSKVFSPVKPSLATQVVGSPTFSQNLSCCGFCLFVCFLLHQSVDGNPILFLSKATSASIIQWAFSKHLSNQSFDTNFVWIRLRGNL